CRIVFSVQAGSLSARINSSRGPGGGTGGLRGSSAGYKSNHRNEDESAENKRKMITLSEKGRSNHFEAPWGLDWPCKRRWSTHAQRFAVFADLAPIRGRSSVATGDSATQADLGLRGWGGKSPKGRGRNGKNHSAPPR